MAPTEVFRAQLFLVGHLELLCTPVKVFAAGRLPTTRRAWGSDLSGPRFPLARTLMRRRGAPAHALTRSLALGCAGSLPPP